MKVQCEAPGCATDATTRVVLIDPCAHLSENYAGDACYCDQHKEKKPPRFKERRRMIPSLGSSWRPEDDPPPFAIRAPLYPDKAFIDGLRARHGEFKVTLRDREGNAESIWATGALEEGLCFVHLLNVPVYYPFGWGEPVLVRSRRGYRPEAFSRENGDR